LILDGNVLSKNTFWKKECSANKVESALLDIVRVIQEHHEDKLTNSLGSVRIQHSPEMKAKENVLPILKKYGIPLEERRGLIERALPHEQESQQVYYVIT
jgi:hypothetical protein